MKHQTNAGTGGKAATTPVCVMTRTLTLMNGQAKAWSQGEAAGYFGRYWWAIGGCLPWLMLK